MIRLLPIMMFTLIFVLLGIGISTQESREMAGSESPLIGTTLPALTLTALGQSTAWDARKNEPVLINIFASWCTPCVAELPELKALKARFPTLQIIGIAWHDTPENVKTWLRDHAAPYDHVYFDADRQTGVKLGIRGVPESFLIDKHTIVRAHIAGPIHAGVIEHDLAPLLTEMTP